MRDWMSQLPGLVLESAPTAVLVLESEELIIRYANPAALTVAGLGRRVLGLPFPVVLPMVRPSVLKLLREVLRDGRAVALEVFESPLLYSADGERTYWNTQVKPLESAEDGTVDCVVIIAQEVTEQVRLRRQAEERAQQLEESERRFRGTFENAPMGIAHVGLDGSPLLVNQVLAEMCGYSIKELMGVSRELLTHPEDLATDHELFQRLLCSEIDRYRIEKRCMRKDGTWFWGRVSVSMQRDAQGESLYIIVCVDDVTEQRQLMEQLSRSNRELERFAYAASHDLKEPIRTVSSFTELLSRIAPAGEESRWRQYLGFISQSARQMEAVVEGLLAFARALEPEIVAEEVDLEAVLQEVLAALSSRIADAQATVTPRGKLPTLLGNRVLLTQALRNLISNALKFRSDAAPLVQLSAERLGDEWIIRVSDNGIGIDPKQHARIFEPFQRLQRDTVSGSGLGLALVKRAVEYHGGWISVESAPGEGASFVFSLPVSGSPASRPAARAEDWS